MYTALVIMLVLAASTFVVQFWLPNRPGLGGAAVPPRTQRTHAGPRRPLRWVARGRRTPARRLG